MGAGAGLQQGQAIILLDQVVQFAPHVLVEPLEQEDVELARVGRGVINSRCTRLRVTGERGGITQQRTGEKGGGGGGGGRVSPGTR